jgi:DNA-damage-inducible protein J
MMDNCSIFVNLVECGRHNGVKTLNDTVQSRVSPELKADAERVFKAMGLKTSDAIRLFLQQTVNIGGLPFRPTAAQPNTETIAALKDTQSGENLSDYDSFDDLKQDLGV